MLIAPAKHISAALPSPSVAPAAEAVRSYEAQRLDPRAAAALNRLCRRRRPLLFTIGDLALQLGADPAILVDPERAGAFVGGSTLDLVWDSADGRTATLTLPRAIVEQVLSLVDPGLAGRPDEPTLSLLIELALMPLIEPLESLVGTPLTLAETRSTPSRLPIGDVLALGFRGAFGGGDFRALLRVAGPDDGILALERLAAAIEARAAVVDSFNLSDLPIPVEIQAGTLRLRLSTLSDMRPGDVLVPDDFPLEHGRVTACAGGRSAAAYADAAGVHLTSSLQPRSVSTEFDMSQDGVFADPASPDHDSTLGDLEVTLVFELGRCQIDLGTLRTLAPGYVFPMPADPAGPVDIVANGRRIGRGEIVRVGETLGVRTTRLFGHE